MRQAMPLMQKDSRQVAKPKQQPTDMTCSCERSEASRNAPWELGEMCKKLEEETEIASWTENGGLPSM